MKVFGAFLQKGPSRRGRGAAARNKTRKRFFLKKEAKTSIRLMRLSRSGSPL
jgi:hypothetical protein